MTKDHLRCVVTGLGAISAIGNSVDECWQNILAAKSGIRSTETVNTEHCYSNLAAEVQQLPEGDACHDRSSILCQKASSEALSDAGLADFCGDRRAAVIMGSCVGGGRSIEHYYTQGKDSSDALKMPISAIANHVAAVCHAGGIVTNIANACAAGTISIAYAAELIRAGKADVVVAGGADAFSPVPFAGFLSLHALDEKPCSPFNRSQGITLGEGAGALIIESYAHAKARGAHIYCEVLGAGISSDAYHITAPRPDGEGQISAIRGAIAASGLTAADIDYINAHGTGTPKNDEAEFLSLHTIFDEENDGLCVSSTKALTGHCLGAAGAIESVFAIKALTEGTVPPTVGYSEAELALLSEKEGKLNFCPNTPVKKPLCTVMDNSFAFGGNNASIVFSKSVGNLPDIAEARDIVITGLGIVSPVGNGKKRYLEACKSGVQLEGAEGISAVGTEEYDALGLKMAFYRKLDHLSQLQAVSGMDAMRDAGYKVTEQNAEAVGIIIGTSEGALSPSCDFQELITQKGTAGGSAFKFPHTVYNAAGGYLSICSGIRGYNVTVTNGAQSGLQSAAYAMQVIRNGQEKAMLATGTDENSQIISELYHGLGLAATEKTQPYDNKEVFSLSDGSVSLLMERADAAAERGAEVYCKAVGYGMAHESVPFGTLSGSEEGLSQAILDALQDANMTVTEIDAVIGFANGMRAVDRIETRVLRRFFDKTPVITVKRRVGEGRAAASALALAHGALLLHGDLKEETDAYCIGGEERVTIDAARLSKVLVISYASGGSYTAVILKK